MCGWNRHTHTSICPSFEGSKSFYCNCILSFARRSINNESYNFSAASTTQHSTAELYRKGQCEKGRNKYVYIYMELIHNRHWSYPTIWWRALNFNTAIHIIILFFSQYVVDFSLFLRMHRVINAWSHYIEHSEEMLMKKNMWTKCIKHKKWREKKTYRNNNGNVQMGYVQGTSISLDDIVDSRYNKIWFYIIFFFHHISCLQHSTRTTYVHTSCTRTNSNLSSKTRMEWNGIVQTLSIYTLYTL